MIKIAEVFHPDQRELWLPIKQCGVDYVVGGFGLQPVANAAIEADAQPWSYMSLLRMKTAYADAGFDLAVIENRPPMEKIKLGLPGRDEEIEVIQAFIRNMGRLQIPVW